MRPSASRSKVAANGYSSPSGPMPKQNSMVTFL